MYTPTVQTAINGAATAAAHTHTHTQREREREQLVNKHALIFTRPHLHTGSRGVRTQEEYETRMNVNTQS